MFTQEAAAWNRMNDYEWLQAGGDRGASHLVQWAQKRWDDIRRGPDANRLWSPER